MMKSVGSIPTGGRAVGRADGLGTPNVYICALVGWDKSHTHNDEEHHSANVSHVNRVDDEGYGLVRLHVSHVVPRMTPPM